MAAMILVHLTVLQAEMGSEVTNIVCRDVLSLWLTWYCTSRFLKSCELLSSVQKLTSKRLIFALSKSCDRPQLPHLKRAKIKETSSPKLYERSELSSATAIRSKSKSITKTKRKKRRREIALRTRRKEHSITSSSSRNKLKEAWC